MANDKDKLIQKIRQGRFVENNGRVLRTINILRTQYIKLSDCCYALDDVAETDFLDCINFLSRAGYIDLRTCDGHRSAQLADHDYEDLEAALSEKGIRLLGGDITDDMVDV